MQEIQQILELHLEKAQMVSERRWGEKHNTQESDPIESDNGNCKAENIHRAVNVWNQRGMCVCKNDARRADHDISQVSQQQWQYS